MAVRVIPWPRVRSAMKRSSGSLPRSPLTTLHSESAPEAEPPLTVPGFWALVKEDRDANHGSILTPGFQAMFMYRLGRWAEADLARRRPARRFARLMQLFIRNFYGIELYWTAQFGRRLTIAHQGATVIHAYCTIGDDCVLRQGVTIGATDESNASGAPVLGDRVDIGAGAMILGEVKIGSDVRIGPNAVVITDVPDHSTVFAPPSRIVRWE